MSRFSGVLVAGLLSAALPFASAVAIMAADAPPPPSAARAAAPSTSASAPFIVDNPDGTFTIQKNATAKGPKAKSGVVIPPQVVVPLFRAAGKKPCPRPHAGTAEHPRPAGHDVAAGGPRR